MNIQEMHNVFRTLGQQMGMQTSRAILPESIDVYLNEAINEKVRGTVINNVATQFKDRVAIQDNSISPINSIRTLVRERALAVPIITGNNDYNIVNLNTLTDVMFYTSFGIKYTNIKKRFGARFIESDKVDDTRDDYLNRESFDHPIVTMLSDTNSQEYIKLFTDSGARVPSTIEISYIELPKVVKWNATLGNAVNCNLPVYIHNEIVELAVNKFLMSVGITTKPVTR